MMDAYLSISQRKSDSMTRAQDDFLTTGFTSRASATDAGSPGDRTNDFIRSVRKGRHHACHQSGPGKVLSLKALELQKAIRPFTKAELLHLPDDLLAQA
jgi:hypothetical protein